MKGLPKLLVVVGCVLLVTSLVLKYAFPDALRALSMKAISFVIWANAAFLLALIAKK